MILEPVLLFGDKGQDIVCTKCGKTITIAETISCEEFYNLPLYLDGFRKGMEDKYFEMKFFGCDKCGWFFKAPRFDKCVYGDKPSRKIKKILNSNMDVMEKRCLISYMMLTNIDNLLELYWYYDIVAKNEEKAMQYRMEIINKLKKEMTTEFGFKSYKLLYVDLLRRSKRFEDALEFLHKNVNPKLLESDEMYNKELKLCEKQNSDRY